MKRRQGIILLNGGIKTEIETIKIAPTDKNGNLLLTNWTNNHKLDEFVENGGKKYA
jgi:hypothetical protein